MTKTTRIETFDRARTAGLSPTKAARYVAYLERFGPTLPLDDAVRQVKAARK